jgi:hypothetical protein
MSFVARFAIALSCIVTVGALSTSAFAPAFDSAPAAQGATNVAPADCTDAMGWQIACV